jgi:hypothetical protein
LVKKEALHQDIIFCSASILSAYSSRSRKDKNRSLKMGKSMYDFGKRAKEKARQQKQMDKASKRIMAKQQKADIIANTPNADSDPKVPIVRAISDQEDTKTI